MLRLSQKCPCCFDAEDHENNSTAEPWLYVVPRTLEAFMSEPWPKLGPTVVLGAKQYHRLDAKLHAWINARAGGHPKAAARLRVISEFAAGHALPAEFAPLTFGRDVTSADVGL